jgi:hypothetical protein
LQPVRNCLTPDAYVDDEDPDDSVRTETTLALLETIWRQESKLSEEEPSEEGRAEQVSDSDEMSVNSDATSTGDVGLRASPIEGPDESHDTEMISPVSPTGDLDEPQTTEMITPASPNEELHTMQLETPASPVEDLEEPHNITTARSRNPSPIAPVEPVERRDDPIPPPPSSSSPLRRSSRIASKRKAGEQRGIDVKRRRDFSQNNEEDKMDVD